MARYAVQRDRDRRDTEPSGDQQPCRDQRYIECESCLTNDYTNREDRPTEATKEDESNVIETIYACKSNLVRNTYKAPAAAS